MARSRGEGRKAQAKLAARQLRDEQYRAASAGRKDPIRRDGPTTHAPAASAVTITRPDGATETLPPYGATRLQRIVKSRDDITASLRASVLRRDRGTCRYCGRGDGAMEIDHVVPVSRGGRGTKSNLVIACRGCNQRKGAETWRPRPAPRRGCR